MLPAIVKVLGLVGLGFLVADDARMRAEAEKQARAEAEALAKEKALEKRRRIEGAIFLAGFIGCIPAANYIVQHFGVHCLPATDTTAALCVIPVLPNIAAPSGVLLIGLAFVLRDLVQRRLGVWWAVAAIMAGAGLSAGFSPASLLLASSLAFLISETADLMVYTPLQKRGLIVAAVASSLVGLVVDSLVFLQLAFGSLDFIWGQIIGKTWMIALAIPFLHLLRARDRRLGMRVV